MNGIYVASKTKHGPMWLALRAQGVPIISSWIDEWEEGATRDRGELYQRCIEEAAQAHATVVYAEPGETLKGALLEWGAALTAERRVFYVGPDHSWTAHPLTIQCSNVESAIALSRLEPLEQRIPRVVVGLRHAQRRVAKWVVALWGENGLRPVSRAYRCVEEALELAQAAGIGRERIEELVRVVWSRPPGRPHQELAGTLVAALAYAEAIGEDADARLAQEIRRIHDPRVIERCRRRETEKRMQGFV